MCPEGYGKCWNNHSAVENEQWIKFAIGGKRILAIEDKAQEQIPPSSEEARLYLRESAKKFQIVNNSIKQNAVKLNDMRLQPTKKSTFLSTVKEAMTLVKDVEKNHLPSIDDLLISAETDQTDQQIRDELARAAPKYETLQAFDTNLKSALLSLQKMSKKEGE